MDMISITCPNCGGVVERKKCSFRIDTGSWLQLS